MERHSADDIGRDCDSNFRRRLFKQRPERMPGLIGGPTIVLMRLDAFQLSRQDTNKWQ